MQESEKWKRDKKPYIVFKCQNCNQFQYTKPTQKTTKCLRCEKIHKTKNVNSIEIINGITNALKRVKELQNELAKEEIGFSPSLQTENDFYLPITTSKTRSGKKVQERKSKESEDLYSKFVKLLSELYVHHKSFPEYLIKIMAKEYGIPKEEITMLKNRAIQRKLLCKEDHGYFKINQKSD